MTFTLLVAAILPSVLLVWYVAGRDLYPEPPLALVCAFVLGALAVVPAALIVGAVRGAATGGIESVPLAALMLSFGLVAPVEEAAKLVVLAGVLSRLRVFNEPMDALVYGAVIGLGFAAAENVAYVAGGGMQIAVLRAITAVPMHAATGVVMGFFFALWRFTPGHRLTFLVVALVAPVALHGAYNFPLIVDDVWRAGARSVPWLRPIALTFLAFEIGLALALLSRIRRTQRAGHHEGAADADFDIIDEPFQRFSIARHLKGPAAVAAGGLAVWSTSVALLTLLAGTIAAYLNAHPSSPAGRARVVSEEMLADLDGGSRIAVVLILLAACAVGVWLFGRGIEWLNRRDRELPRQGGMA